MNTGFTLDSVASVLGQTVFSPYLAAIPVVLLTSGWKSETLPKWAVYCFAVSLLRLVKHYSLLHRSQGSLFSRPTPVDWSKQVVVVTGGASGVGRLLATTLAARNARVAVLDVSPRPPAAADDEPIAYYKCDVSKWEEVEAVAKTIREEVGTPTMVINNAGVCQGKLLLDLSPKDINQTFGVNNLAHFWTAKAFLPDMVQKKEGHIVTISSIMAVLRIAQMTDYCATKGALVAYHESLRYELDNKYHCPKIRTTLLCPSWINTPLGNKIVLPLAGNPLFDFVFPALQPADVVNEIMGALESQQSRWIVTPFSCIFGDYINLLPSFIRDVVQWATRLDDSMNEYTRLAALQASEGEKAKQNGGS